jgi:manganese efflux pump family protein
MEAPLSAPAGWASALPAGPRTRVVKQEVGGGQGHRRRQITAVFTAFEFAIPLFGIWLGEQVSRALARPADWVGPLALSMIGLWSILSAMRDQPNDETLARRAASGGGLVLLAGVMSVDNLIIGFSLGLRHFNPLAVAATIALFSAAFTWLGLSIGSAARRRRERFAKAAAGLFLLTAGVVMATTLVYTVYGGLRSSIFTDAVQLVIILPVLLTILVIGWIAVGASAWLPLIVDGHFLRMVYGTGLVIAGHHHAVGTVA